MQGVINSNLKEMNTVIQKAKEKELKENRKYQQKILSAQRTKNDLLKIGLNRIDQIYHKVD